jgi:Fe-S cluster biogenesis protein NfuA
VIYSGSFRRSPTGARPCPCVFFLKNAGREPAGKANKPEFDFIVKLIQNERVHLLRRMIMHEKVKAALEEIRPALQADGGDVELVGIKDGTVSVKLKGACGGCPMATMTLKKGIERILKERVPEVKEVISVK